MTGRKSDFWRGVAIICTVWLLGIAVLLAGTLSHASIGFLWPMGQDLDWSILLKQGVGQLAAEQEFAFDHRNPLSGWVYSLAAPLILGSTYGFHIFRLLSCLMLGLCVYGMICRFCQGGASYFAVLIGTIISIWWFWSNVTQVVALMLIAYAASVLVVWLYCAYVDSGRTKGALYAWSLALWLATIGTYTIQCGAIIPIFAIALLRGSPRGFWPAVRDSLPYAVIGVVFGAIWIAAAAGFFSEPVIQQTTHAAISFDALMRSIRYLFWHPVFKYLVSTTFSSWPAMFFVGVAIVVLPGLLLLQRLTIKAENFEMTALRNGALWTIVLAFGLAAPTVFLEATSSTWKPGTRSDMMFAAFVPMVTISVAALIGSFLGRRTATRLLFATSVLLAVLVVSFDFEQNRQGTAIYAWQKKLVDGIRPFQADIPTAIHIVVFDTSGAQSIGNPYGPRFAQDKFDRIPLRWAQLSSASDTTLRFVESTEAPPGYAGSWPIIYTPSAVIGAVYGSAAPVPRGSVLTFAFDGNTVRPITKFEPSDIAGWQISMRDTD